MIKEEKKRGQSPFLYFDYSDTEKSERWKKGDCPLFLPGGKKMPIEKRNLKKGDPLDILKKQNSVLIS